MLIKILGFMLMWLLLFTSCAKLLGPSGEPGDGMANLDTLAPNAPSGLQVDMSSGTVNYNTFGNRAITWTDNGDNGPAGIAYFKLKVNETESTFVSGNSYNFSADGTYILRVRAVDKAGNTSIYSNAVIVIMNTTGIPMTGNFRIKSDGTGPIYHNSPISLVSVTWDQVADAAGINHYVIIDSLTNGIDSECDGTGESTSFNTVGNTSSANLCFSPGNHNITVIAVNNNAINITFTGTLILVVDTQCPSAIASLQVGGSGTIYITNLPGNPAITWAGGTDNGAAGLKASPYEVMVTDITTGASTSYFAAASPYSGIAFAGSKQYILQARSWDKANNAGPWSNVVAVTVDNSITPMPGNFKINGDNVGPVYHYSTTSTLSITWDQVATISGINHYIIHDSLANGIDSNCDGTGETTDYNTLTDKLSANLCFISGSHNISVYAVTNGGFSGSSTGVINLTIDNQAPNAITSLQVGGSATSYITNLPGNPAITWAGGTDNGAAGLKASPYEVMVTDFTAGTTNSYFAASSPSTMVNFSANKQYYIKVRAWDKANNAGPWSNIVSVIVDNAPPTFPANLRVNGFTAAYATGNMSNTFITWDAVINDLTGIQYYAISIDDGATQSGGNITGNTFTIRNFDFTVVTCYYVKIKSVDNLNNDSGWSATNVPVCVDNIIPSDITFIDTGSYTAPNANFSWNAATDDLAGVRYYHVKYKINAGWNAEVLVTGTSYSIDLSSYVSGTKATIQVRTEDNAGNLSASWIVSATVTKP